MLYATRQVYVVRRTPGCMPSTARPPPRTSAQRAGGRLLRCHCSPRDCEAPVPAARRPHPAPVLSLSGIPCQVGYHAKWDTIRRPHPASLPGPQSKRAARSLRGGRRGACMLHADVAGKGDGGHGLSPPEPSKPPRKKSERMVLYSPASPPYESMTRRVLGCRCGSSPGQGPSHRGVPS